MHVWDDPEYVDEALCDVPEAQLPCAPRAQPGRMPVIQWQGTACAASSLRLHDAAV